MRISIILPILNEEKFMDIALTSLQEQTMLYDELIIVDNESTDTSVAVARGYTNKIFSAPKGKLNALQTGVAMALGDIIFTVDADCWFPPDYIERMMNHFINNSNVVLVLASVYHDGFTPNNNFLEGIKVSFLYYLLKYGPGPARAFRREAFMQAGGLNLNVNQFNLITNMFEEEVGLHQRLAQLGKVIRDTSIIVHHANRRMVCDVCQNTKSENAICEYCSEIQRRERF